MRARRLVLLVIGLTLTGPVAAGAMRPHVVGGAPVVSGTLGFVGALVPSNEPDVARGQYCGAALIAPQTVITAAHCVLNTNPADVDVVLGRSRLSATGGVRLHVAGITMHPAFATAGGSPAHDVAVLRLATPATGVTPVKLGAAGDPPGPGSPLFVVGWGVTNLEGAAPDDLQIAAVQRIDDATCASDYGRGFGAASMFCAGQPGGGVDTCAGDSGGPILENTADGWRAVGLVSFGISCAVDRFPGVYSRITAADTHDWLSSTPADTPFQLTPPSLDGDAAVGSRLRCGNGEWLPAKGLAFSRLWLRDEKVIDGATGLDYRIVAADRGSTLSCVVLAGNASGTVGAESSSTGTVSARLAAHDTLAPRASAPHVRCTGTRCVVQVTATDAARGTGVAAVEVAIRSGATLLILDARHAGGARWTLTRTLPTGAATVLARAIDHAGNRQRLAARTTTTVPAAAAAPTRLATKRPRIIDGQRASTVDFPFVAALVDASTANAADGQFCGGTLVAPTTVVTAAHCAMGTPPDQIDAVFGRDSLSGAGGERIHVVAVSWDPAFTMDALRHDIAVLHLAHAPAAPIVPVPPVTAADVGALAGGSPAQIVGWGAIYDSPETQVYPDDLRQATVTLASDVTCAHDVGRAFDAGTMTCAATVGGRNVCNGDSGGPLLVSDGSGGWRLAGITSWGLRCGSDVSPAVFGRVLSLRSFLDAEPAPGPIQTGPVYLDGSFAARSPIRCHVAGRFTAPPSGYGAGLRFTYRWFLSTFDGQAELKGQTGPTYTPKSTAFGDGLQCAVTVANGGGTLAEQFSDSITIGAPVSHDRTPPAIARPTISCTATIGASTRRCVVRAAATDGGTGIARVSILVDIAVNGTHRTVLLDGGTAGSARLPALAPGATCTVAARAVDGAGNRSRTARAVIAA